jgi:branched-chain amino acid transport system ATP-binding protein
MLDVEHLTVRRGATVAVNDVSLAVASGDVVALVGPNGAGKSTLARAISGSHRPVGGRIRFDGTDITRLGAAAIAARGLTHLPEGRPLALTLTVRDNLLAGAHVLGSHALARQRLEEVLPDFPVLRQRLHLPAAALSGGERQWLVVARALMSRPRLLLIDEPTLGLGPRAARQTLDLIAGLRRSGAGILVIEQNAVALSVADRALVMANGCIVAAGAPGALLDTPDVMLAYLGRRPRDASGLRESPS